jgi:DNA modification methylase
MNLAINQHAETRKVSKLKRQRDCMALGPLEAKIVTRGRAMFGNQLSLGLRVPFQLIADTPAPTGYLKRKALFERYAEKLQVNHDLNRTLVSFQANKEAPFYRWLKYKEGFSSTLVCYFLEKFRPTTYSIGRVLDPFAGAGTTLITAAKNGWRATGIELMPVGISAVRARCIADTVSIKQFEEYLAALKKYSVDPSSKNSIHFRHLRITERAFPNKTEQAICAYHTFLKKIRPSKVRYLFWFALLSILEAVSYTRKDGQYLRWDSRSARSLKSNFNKGKIEDFWPAITQKLEVMLQDLRRRKSEGLIAQNVKMIEGSCLIELLDLPEASFDLAITSPPYCNRYDYTRTYALELALLGYDEQDVKNLRQSLLSATVENRSKLSNLFDQYRRRRATHRFNAAMTAFTNQEALYEVLTILYEAQKNKELNNNNIPSMVENYFLEMNFVIHELARVLAPGGHIVMINDNVQYHGEEIPVDLILSDLAANSGLSIDEIWVLPRGKGNSSQQMGAHGRKELRKCVYIWSKPITGRNSTRIA